MRWLMLAPMLVAIAACSGGNRDAETADPAKLSAELEQRAQAIEERAAVAVRDAETQADAELAALRAEAEAANQPADNDDGTAAAEE